MAFSIFCILVIINIILAISHKNNKYFSGMLVFWLWATAAFSYKTVDYVNYKSSYNAGSFDNSIEYGYNFLIHLFNSFGFTYEQFQVVLVSIILVLLILCYKKFTVSSNLVAACFSIYPFFMHCIQLRTALSSAILSFAIIYFLVEKKFLRYLISIIIASSIHFTFYIYLIFLLYPFLNTKWLRKLLISFLVLFLGASVFAHFNNSSFLNFINTLVISDSRIQYWTSGKTNLGFIAYWLLQLVTIYISYMLFKNSKDDENYFDYIRTIYYCNILNLVSLPLLTLASTFGRLISNMLFVNILNWQLLPKSYINRSGSIVIREKPFRLFLCVLIIFFLWLQLELINDFDIRVMVDFTNNYFFQYFGI